MSAEKKIDLYRTERSFLFAFVSLRLLLLARYFGMFLGYDVRGHLDSVSSIRWSSPFLPLDFSYYAWHPPLGFLLTHTITLFGISPVLSAQLLSFAATMIAFLFMRMTLRSLGFLSDLRGILFLYIGASIPLQIYLSVIVSLDVFVFCIMSIVLFLSVQLFWRKQGFSATFFYSIALILALVLAIFSKLSGLLLLPLPFLAYVLAGTPRSFKNMLVMFLVTAIPSLIGILYLYYRYYLPQHAFFFNSAGTLVWIRSFAEAIVQRDSDRIGFFLSYLLPIHDGPRLAPTWASFWYMFDTRQTSFASVFIGISYYIFSIIPCVAGVISFLRADNRSLWHRFGVLIFSIASIQLLGLFYYIYALPMSGFYSNKGIYIASACWAIAYLLPEGVHFLIMHVRSLYHGTLSRYESTMYALCFAAFFMMLNHFVPGIGEPSLDF